MTLGKVPFSLHRPDVLVTREQAGCWETTRFPSWKGMEFLNFLLHHKQSLETKDPSLIVCAADEKQATFSLKSNLVAILI